MVLFRVVPIVIFLVFTDTVFALLNTTSGQTVSNDLKIGDTNTRRKGKGYRSTSSSSGERKSEMDDKSGSGAGDSLELSISQSSSASASSPHRGGNNKYKPQSSNERRGWRKWHRKCTPCPAEMKLKWRDPRVQWICGGYQRARRSFKSLCMMHYRNCQDGTMFVMIHRHRCSNSSTRAERPWGQHFFYDYKVEISGDSSKSDSDSSPSDTSASSFENSSRSKLRRHNLRKSSNHTKSKKD